MEDVNKQRRNFISLSELGYGPLKFSFGMVRLHLTSKWVGIITIKTERTQIHFLSDVLVAVASLDLKVAVNYTYARGWHVHQTTFERNSSLGHHHVVWNGKTKLTS